MRLNIQSQFGKVVGPSGFGVLLEEAAPGEGLVVTACRSLQVPCLLTADVMSQLHMARRHRSTLPSPPWQTCHLKP